MIKNRDLYNQLLQHLDKKEYSIIIGARQVCKTTLIQQMYSELKKSFSDVYFNDLGIRNKLLNRFYNINDREDKGQCNQSQGRIQL